ncbi:MAG: HDIG domain-containing metalloprotein [Chlamydiota bacterium]|nr:HDIG domain-containing metalloprotein [Chlamydiota bacterium]
MHDKQNELKNDSELKYSREQGFFDKSSGIRALIAAFFILCLFVFLHFRDVRVETLEIGSLAKNFTVAQVDFDFFDNEATLILRQQAVTDIGKIYEISQKEVRKRRDVFEEFLVKNQEWRDQVGDSTFEEMYQGMDAIENLMIKLRFTDPRTFNKMEEVGLDINDYLIFTPAELTERVRLPRQVWEYISTNALPDEDYQQNTKKFIIDHFENQGWLFEEDIPAQRKLRTRVQSAVPEKYTRVSAGNRIIDQGDKVTARHLAMLQSMKNALRERRNLWHPLTLFGSFIMSVLLTMISYAYLNNNHRQIVQSNRKLFLLVTIIIFTLALSKLTEFFLISSYSNLIEVVRYPVFVPFAAIMLCSLMNANIATFASGFLVIVLSMTLAFDRHGFMIMNLATAMVAILNTKTLRKRKEIFVVCGKSLMCAVLIAFSINFYNNTLWGVGVFTDVLSVSIFMLLTAIMVVGLLPLFESSFRIMTDVTLMEFMDPNNDLLRRLSIEAPGTYQHSVVVGNLAESAALSIGANGLFCRVSTLYHDIGKMVTPQYFTENQQAGMNIHQLLTPLESAQVIIAHVSEGVVMARKAGLPEQFIDIIKEHHGTTLVYYFYKKQLEKVEGDITQVDEKDFRYSGPRPRSKESAIIMIADTLEAASRSLETVDEDTIRELATRLIKEKAEDGQFDECLLTFEELAIVRETLIKTLCAFAHSRVKYPRRDSER